MRNIGYASAADKELEEGRTSGASDNVAAVEQLPHFLVRISQALLRRVSTLQWQLHPHVPTTRCSPGHSPRTYYNEMLS
jgi:hypothetical protein